MEVLEALLANAKAGTNLADMHLSDTDTDRI